MSDTRIVILGGGFAGATLAAALEKRLARELHAYSNGNLDRDDVTFIFTEVTEKLPCHSQEAA